MFGIGMPEMLLILAVALIVIGPKKLPELAKSLGRAFGEFKKATNELKGSLEMDTGYPEVTKTFDSVGDDLKASVDDSMGHLETPNEDAKPEAEEKEETPESAASHAEAKKNGTEKTEKDDRG